MTSSSKEEIAHIEGLAAFCQPVEIYNLIDVRGSREVTIKLCF